MIARPLSLLALVSWISSASSVASAAPSHAADAAVLKTNHFTTIRGFTKLHKLSLPYGAYLGDEFVKDVGNLTPEQKWVDMGAGRGRALVEALDEGNHFQGLGVGYVHPEPAQLTKDLETHPSYHYLEGDLFSHDLEKLGGRGQVDLISDVFGPGAYSSDLEGVLKIYGTLLKPGGKLYLIHNFDVPNEGVNFLFDKNGNELHYKSLFGNIQGLRLVTDEHQSFGPLLVFERTAADLKVPHIEWIDSPLNGGMARQFRLLSDVPLTPQPKPPMSSIGGPMEVR